MQVARTASVGRVCGLTGHQKLYSASSIRMARWVADARSSRISKTLDQQHICEYHSIVAGERLFCHPSALQLGLLNQQTPIRFVIQILILTTSTRHFGSKCCIMTCSTSCLVMYILIRAEIPPQSDDMLLKLARSENGLSRAWSASAVQAEKRLKHSFFSSRAAISNLDQLAQQCASFCSSLSFEHHQAENLYVTAALCHQVNIQCHAADAMLHCMHWSPMKLVTCRLCGTPV